MKKKNGYVLLITVLLSIILIQWVIPPVLLQLSKADEPQRKGKGKELSYYINTYDQSLNRFLNYESMLEKTWKSVHHEKILVGKTGLTQDYMIADANGTRKNLIVLTAGVHGIEGYQGSAMLDVFQHEFLSKINPENTGIVIVHSVNPWGMKNFRRYNENNVDLNRNFIYNWKTFNLNKNKDYSDLAAFFEKNSGLGNSTLHEIGFYAGLGKEAVFSGTGKIQDALLTGQYTNPNGVYFGGNSDTDSTKLLKKLYKSILKAPYSNIVHVDIHTGYGPRSQMSIFSSSNETMNQKEAEKAFNYPLVLTPDAEDYYVTNGDNTEYFNKLKQSIAPHKTLYSTTFEFGTLGEDMPASIQSLKNTIDENRLYQHGSTSKITEKIIRNRYLQMFYPTDEKWRKKAVRDFRQGLTGVLVNRGIMKR
ncbi:M14 family metallopeptidase [Actinomycetes bacterium NPDC127524]